MTATRAQRIEEALQNAFTPQRLEVLDESAQHAGHMGARPEGETHFRVRIQAAELSGKSRVAAHRAVNGVLKAEFETGLHALAIEVVG